MAWNIAIATDSVTCGCAAADETATETKMQRARTVGTVRALWPAEDTRFELVKGCPQHAFQLFVRVSSGVHPRPDLPLSEAIHPLWTPANEAECNPNCNPRRSLGSLL